MFNLFHHRERVQRLQHKEVLIEKSQEKFANSVQVDVEQINKINKVLGNGITLSIAKAVGAQHR